MQSDVKGGLAFELPCVPVAMLRFAPVRGRRPRGTGGVAAHAKALTRLFEDAWAICARHGMCVFVGAAAAVRATALGTRLLECSPLHAALVRRMRSLVAAAPRDGAARSAALAAKRR